MNRWTSFSVSGNSLATGCIETSHPIVNQEKWCLRSLRQGTSAETPMLPPGTAADFASARAIFYRVKGLLE